MARKLPFRVVVAGSRTISDQELIFGKLNHYLGEKMKTHEITVISGCARGPDTIGETWARKNRLKVHLIAADWDRHGRAAGMIRNKLMCDSCDAVIAFFDGQSHGTRNMIDLAIGAKKMLRVVRCNQAIS